MPVSAEIHDLCRMTFTEADVPLALHVLNTYEGEQPDQVHRAVIKLSEGNLHLLASWVGGLSPTQQGVETLFWFAGAMEPEATEKQVFGAGWMNSYYKKNRLTSQGDAS
ncbi:hypothetical protein ACIBI4_14045 [Streptomyces sp. NPDC050418]|uniref:hypothetical protein n=1 Tax=Streptomyces sp. NPDC050418 TaxID=3365612 RepID=UPI00378B0B00